MAKHRSFKAEKFVKAIDAVFIYSAELEKYHYPLEHPFSASRAGKVREILSSANLLSGKNRSEAAPVAATKIELKKFHSARYL